LKLFYAILLLSSFLFRPVYEVTNVAYYELNIDYVIEKYCVNKAKPEMHCDGKCFLNSQLNKLDNPTSKDNKGIALSKTFIPAFFENVSYPNLEATALFFKLDNWGDLNLHKYTVINAFEHPPNASF